MRVKIPIMIETVDKDDGNKKQKINTYVKNISVHFLYEENNQGCTWSGYFCPRNYVNIKEDGRVFEGKHKDGHVVLIMKKSDLENNELKFDVNMDK